MLGTELLYQAGGLVGLITGVGVRTDGGVEIMVTRHGGPVVAGGHVE